MRRQLYIIRHGKSSWDHEDLDDIDRPLNPRGLRSAKMMAERLKDAGLVPELIYSSPAKRALNTALIMQEVWGLDSALLKVRDQLYMAYLQEISEVIAQAPAEVKSLAIFGHNPSFTMFANRFLKASLDNLPTAGVVVVDLDSESWSDLDRKQVIETFVDTPR